MTRTVFCKTCDADWLRCPHCDTPAIMASGKTVDGTSTWNEDDEVTCHDCGTRIRANIAGDDEGREWVEAIEVEP